jgi:hypothetical protein
MRPAYFTVSLLLGKETPAIHWDELPYHHPIRSLVYVVRLDTLPGYTAQPLDKLYRTFCHLRKHGELPPRWEPPKRPPAEPAKPRIGHREVHPRRYLPDLPYP